MKEKLKILTLKIESAYKTDSVPTVATNVLLAQDVDVNPLEMELDDYTPVNHKFGEYAKIMGAKWCSVSFAVVLCGGGTPVGNAGQAPNHDPILRASALARVVTAGVNISYSPIDAGEESVTMYYYMGGGASGGGVLQKILGLRGDLEWVYEAGKAPRLMFAGKGLHVPMVDEPLPTSPTLPTPPRPLAVNSANTSLVLGAGSYPLRVSSLNFRLGNDLQYRNNLNVEDVVLVDRKMSGRMTLELPSVAEQDLLGAAGICTLAATTSIFMVHGSLAGNRVITSLPTVQLLQPKPRPLKGILMLDCEIHVIGNAFITYYE